MLQDVWLAIDERRYDQAEKMLREDKELLPTRAGQMALGYLLAHTSRQNEARDIFQNLREQHRDDEWEHIAVHQLGRVERLAKRPKEALALLREERDLIQGLPDEDHKLAVNGIEMGQCFIMLNRFEDAREEVEKSVEYGKKQNDPEVLGRAERTLAAVSLAEGHPDAARLHLERALVAFKESEDDFAIREIEAQLANEF